jgi:hypothetical protein
MLIPVSADSVSWRKVGRSYGVRVRREYCGGHAVSLYWTSRCIGAHSTLVFHRTVPLDEMQRKFGEESIWVWNILRGIDHSEGE